MKKLFMCALATFFGGSLGSQAADSTPDEVRAVEQAIDEKSRVFERCYAAQDAECLVSGYYVSDDQQPVVYPPGGNPPVRGRAALSKMFEGEFKAVQSIRLERFDVAVRGDMAHEVGRALLTLHSGGTANGRYAVLWIRGKDGWRAKVDFVATDGWVN